MIAQGSGMRVGVLSKRMLLRPNVPGRTWARGIDLFLSEY
jgi:hypothetical protein